MTTNPDIRNLPSAIASRLSRLRLLIRVYILLQGLAALLGVMAVGFWFTLIVDWIAEPTPIVRAVLLVVLGMLAMTVLYRVVVSRLIVPLSDRNMAVLLERQHRKFGDRLLTVVELADRTPEGHRYDPNMLAHTRGEANQMMSTASAAPVFNFGPLARYVLIAAALAATAAAFLYFQADAAKIWLNRSLMLGDAQWPRATKISVEGFPLDERGVRMVKVARGSHFTVRASADTGFEIPNVVEIRYTADEQSVRRPNMTQLKTAIPGRDAFQFYEYKFSNIQTTTVFDVVAKGGPMLAKNDTVEGLVIEAVESPDLDDIRLSCRYPDYLARDDESFSVRLVRPLPEGTEVTVLAEASKDLISASYRKTLQSPEAAWQPIAIDQQRPRALSFEFGQVDADTRIEFRLVDSDGVSNQQPIRMLIRVTPDEVPTVDVELVGIGKAITPLAELPVRGEIRDDHGIVQTWFDYRVDDQPAARRDFTTPDDGRLDDVLGLNFPMGELGVEPGSKLTLTVAAADNYALSGKPHVASGQRYLLQVVSESALRSMLETRERILRRRFESIIAEMNRMRDSLVRMESDAGDIAPSTDPEAEPPAEKSGDAGDPDQTVVVDRSDRLASIRLLRAETAIQTSDRMRHETASVASEFARILLELENNNVTFIAELRRRLGEGISDPLNAIAEHQFPQLDDRLRGLRQSIGDEQRRPRAVAESLKRVDAIVEAMNVVLENMLELQKFNELLADLRKIIDAQKQVSQLTEEERKAAEQRLKEELKKGLLD